VLTGAFLTPAGAPAAARPVVVTRVSTAGDAFSDLFTFTFSFGLAALTCLDSSEPALETCHAGGFRAVTDGTGRFSMRLRNKDVRSSSTGGLRDLSVATGVPPQAGEVDGARVAVTVSPDAGRVRAPTLRLWDGGVTVHQQVNRFTISWQPAPDAASAYKVGLADTSRGLHLTVKPDGAQAVVDPRLIEDAVPTYSVAAEGRAPSGASVEWEAATVRYAGGAGAPLSRGKPCTAQLGTALARPLTTCWADDGDFGSTYSGARPRYCTATDPHFPGDLSCLTAPVTAMTIDLQEIEPLALVIVRPTETHGTAVAVTASKDGRTWQTVGEAHASLFDTEPLAVVPPAGMSARFVRVTPNGSVSASQPMTPDAADDPFATPRSVPRDRRAIVSDFRGDLASVAEVSVWKGQPAPPVTSTNGVRNSGAHTRDSVWALVTVAAAVLLAGVIGGLGYLVGRRRSAPPSP
jgi:hypothetical protein